MSFFHPFSSTVSEFTVIGLDTIILVEFWEAELTVLVIGCDLIGIILGEITISNKWESNRDMVGVDSFGLIIEIPGMIITGFQESAGTDIRECEPNVIGDTLGIIKWISWNYGSLLDRLFIIDKENISLLHSLGPLK